MLVLALLLALQAPSVQGGSRVVMINPTPSPACLASRGSLTEPSKCEFPFIHEGIAYDTCIATNHTAFWCYTDDTSGHWGECAIGCPIGQCVLLRLFPRWLL